MVITLYGKAGCHLCDEARDMIEELASEREFELREVDIRHDPALMERYRYRIPVIVADGAEVIEGRFVPMDLVAALGW